MFNSKKVVVYSVIVILISIIIIYIFISNNDRDDKEGVKTNNALTQNDLNISQNKASELQSEEKRLIEAVNSWELGKPKNEIAEAIKKLGKLRSETAVPVLIKKIQFNYMPPERDKDIETKASTPAKDKFLAVFALAEIGRKSFPPITQRIKQLDSDKLKDLNIIFQLAQAISHMKDLSKSETAVILKKEAEKTVDKKGKKSLLFTASFISIDFGKDISEMSEQELIKVVEYGSQIATIVFYPDKYKKIFEAVNRLGEMRSEAAIPILVKNVDFSYAPKNFYAVMLSSMNRLHSFKERECVVYALRNIGRKAVPQIIKQISQINPKTNIPVSQHAQLNQDEKRRLGQLYNLEKALAGMRGLPKEDVINIIKQEAKKATDNKIKERLLLAASKVKTIKVISEKSK